MHTSNTFIPATTVTSKGQVTIPAEVRHHLGIKPKDKVRFEVTDDGSVQVVPATSRLAALFDSVKPTPVHKNDSTLRREFEEGVAEGVLRRDEQ